jgi:hypothetical protein
MGVGLEVLDEVLEGRKEDLPVVDEVDWPWYSVMNAG